MGPNHRIPERRKENKKVTTVTRKYSNKNISIKESSLLASNQKLFNKIQNLEIAMNSKSMAVDKLKFQFGTTTEKN